MRSRPFCEQRELKPLCTFGIGGAARYYGEAKTLSQAVEIFELCQQWQLPFFVLGKGSNLLFADRGFDGVVIANKISFCEEGAAGLFRVGAGYSFSHLGSLTAKKGWSGLEFAAAIPGSVGGAIYMNAGAQGQETSHCLISLTFLTPEGKLLIWKKEELSFAYRYSSLHHLPGMIIDASFQLTYDPEARARQRQQIEYRLRTQPYGEKSAGSIFKNPLPIAAGALIEASGLKGRRVGGVSISTKHANFIVNDRHGMAKDVLELIQQVQEKVHYDAGALLIPEIQIIPYQKAS